MQHRIATVDTNSYVATLATSRVARVLSCDLTGLCLRFAIILRMSVSNA